MSGLLGKSAMNATPVRVARVNGNPALDGAVAVNVLIVNNTNAIQEAKIWMSNSESAPADGDLISPKILIPAYGTFEVAARLCSAGEYVYVQCAANTFARVEGTPFEEAV